MTGVVAVQGGAVVRARTAVVCQNSDDKNLSVAADPAATAADVTNCPGYGSDSGPRDSNPDSAVAVLHADVAVPNLGLTGSPAAFPSVFALRFVDAAASVVAVLVVAVAGADVLDLVIVATDPVAVAVRGAVGLDVADSNAAAAPGFVFAAPDDAVPNAVAVPGSGVVGSGVADPAAVVPNAVVVEPVPHSAGCSEPAGRCSDVVANRCSVLLDSGFHYHGRDRVDPGHLLNFLRPRRIDRASPQAITC